MHHYFRDISKQLAIATLLLVALCVSAQQAFPSKHIRFIVPYPTGSGTLVARLVGDKVAESLGQPVVVESRPGGDTIIGATVVAKASPDGYTIMLISGSHVTLSMLHKSVPFDVIADFSPVATLTASELVLAINPSMDANSLSELIALAKSKPNQLSYASTGSGGPSHLAAELFNSLTGVQVANIPYKGSGPAVTDLIGGHVQMYFGPPSLVINHIKAGTLRGIAVSGGTRLSAAPQMSTFTEAGLAGFDVRNWYGVLAPRETPKAVVDRLSIEIGKALAHPDVVERLSTLGFSPFISSPEQTLALMKNDMVRMAKIIYATNIKPE